MEKVWDWTTVAFESMITLGQSIMMSLPNIFGAIFLILLGWLLAKVVSFLVRRGLKLAGLDKLTEKITSKEILSATSIKISASDVVAKFVYWVIILLFFVTASDTLGWAVVSQSIGDLIAYLPKLFSAVVIFIIGLYIAGFVRTGLQGLFESMGVASGKIVSSFAYYMILVILTLTAMNQAGIDTQLITSNVTIILGGVVLAFAVSFGLGSREVLTNILSSFYTKSNYQEGQEIEINGIKGTIEKMNSTSCTIKTSNGLTVIPISKLLSEVVHLKK